ncbi:3-deoxy-D-manno-octulosonate 8-phosphate phosphatase (KDO 8-P phosphatase) [Granulicella pectinivorans]|uniref:3-deoxy-D-manno-octulosonate 8-phosphate phosphatase (KDO 8-P phosphatase) n=1 Tax=Granulicella pectinivorans TaxID=474950 RepID=A0A1I6M3B5_9BACT|nr:HAD hydrolase family protein [Granulicella pectinivorans]SFS10180.1 3-deoxy-D-manno-octulosonate 8-phosphate phosphatase (KDO 8-P phosphatase) [Granulicella pectinivorans]
MAKRSKQLTDGLQNLQAIAFDVDGTLTDGTLTWNASDPASESKSFHFADIMGISLARRLGIQLALISGEPSPLVDRFADKLRIPHVIKGCRDKATALREWSEKTGAPLADTCFFGDDVNDLWAMEIAGLCACPADAAEEVVRYVSAHPRGFVSQQLGGAGAVREFVDALLKVRNLEGKHVFKLRPPE